MMWKNIFTLVIGAYGHMEPSAGLKSPMKSGHWWWWRSKTVVDRCCWGWWNRKLGSDGEEEGACDSSIERLGTQRGGERYEKNRAVSWLKRQMTLMGKCAVLLIDLCLSCISICPHLAEWKHLSETLCNAWNTFSSHWHRSAIFWFLDEFSFYSTDPVHQRENVILAPLLSIFSLRLYSEWHLCGGHISLVTTVYHIALLKS